MAIRAEPTDTRLTHHIKLSKDGTELGIILCDGKGNPDPKAIRQGNNPRTSLQIRQGDASYSDFEMPYTPITQKDWSGGRGLEDFETDQSRYFDSRNINTAHGRAFLGPKMIQTTVLDTGGAGMYLNGNVHFFEYKGATYFISQPDNGTSAGAVFMNGYRGVAQTGSTTTVINTTLNLSGVNLAGKSVQITAGTGFTAECRWRKILSNTTTGTNDTITVRDAWTVAPDTTTEFVVYGVEYWIQVVASGTLGITKPVTSVVVINDVIYFAQGESTNIRRVKWWNSAGTWTLSTADDGTNKAFLLKLIPKTTGGARIWRVLNGTGTGTSIPQASFSELKQWGTDLDFTTKPSDVTSEYPIPLTSANSQRSSKVTNIEAYGDPTQPWIIKEDEIGSIENAIYSPVPLSEMRAVKHDMNGRAVMQYGVYLFFSLLDGVERYYNQRLDDIGPNRDLGFQHGRKGKVCDMLPYPGQVFMSYDAEWSGYSSILTWNGIGYHELVRSPAPNMRIRNMWIQTTPDIDEPDRLYFVYGPYIYYIHVSINPLAQKDYKYTDYGYIMSAKINGGFAEIYKYWHEARVFLDKYAEDRQYARVSYRTTGGVEPITPLQLSTTVQGKVLGFMKLTSTGYRDVTVAVVDGTTLIKYYGSTDYMLSVDSSGTLSTESGYLDVSFYPVSLPDGSALIGIGDKSTKTRIYKFTHSGSSEFAMTALHSSYFDTTNPKHILKMVACDSNNIYVITSDLLVYRSADGGVTWVTQLTSYMGTDIKPWSLTAHDGYCYLIALGIDWEESSIYRTAAGSGSTFTVYIGIASLEPPEEISKLLITEDEHFIVMSDISSSPYGNMYIYDLGPPPFPYAGIFTVPQEQLYTVPIFSGVGATGTLSSIAATGGSGFCFAYFGTVAGTYDGTPRGTILFSHNYGRSFIPYRAGIDFSSTGHIFRLNDDCMLYGMTELYTGLPYVYRSDSDYDWIAIDEDCFEAVTEVSLSEDDSVSGQKIQYMVELFSTQEKQTPVLKAITLDAVTRLPGKKSWTLSFLLDDMAVDLQGVRESLTAQEKITLLEGWADSATTPTPIDFYNYSTVFNGRKVFIEYPVITPIEVVNTEQPHKIKLLCQLTMIEA